MNATSTFPLTILDLVPYHPDKPIAMAFEESKNLAQKAEQFGYNRYWIAEHHSIEGIASAATSVVIAYIAGATKSIRVGSGGIMLPNHAPMIVAEQFGTLATLFPNRIDLGLGRAPGSDRSATRAIRGSEPRHDDFANLIAELMAFFAPVQPGQRLMAVPGAGLRIPLYILGSSLYSAHLAAELGRPYAFAGHFAPALMMQALDIYRKEFRPSEFLSEPYVMVGCPVVCAETDERAEFLATTVYQAFLNLIRGTPRGLNIAPVSSMTDRWLPHEEDAVRKMLEILVVGDPERTEKGLQQLIERTGANELIVSSNFYHAADRVRSYELVRQLKLKPASAVASKSSAQSVRQLPNQLPTQ